MLACATTPAVKQAIPIVTLVMSVNDFIRISIPPNVQSSGTAAGGKFSYASVTIKFHISTEISRGSGCWLQCEAV
jgi:hypothetical protein